MIGVFIGLASMLGRGSSARKSNLRLIARRDSEGSGVVTRIRATGAAEDCLRGEEPILVLYGEWPAGGGSVVRVLFNRRLSDSTCVGSRSEPM